MNEEPQFYTPLDRHLHVISNLPGGFPAVVMVHMTAGTWTTSGLPGARRNTRTP